MGSHPTSGVMALVMAATMEDPSISFGMTEKRAKRTLRQRWYVHRPDRFRHGEFLPRLLYNRTDGLIRSNVRLSSKRPKVVRPVSMRAMPVKPARSRSPVGSRMIISAS